MYINNDSKNFTVKDSFLDSHLEDEYYKSDFLDRNSIITQIYPYSSSEKYDDQFFITFTMVGNMILGHVKRNFNPYCSIEKDGEKYYNYNRRIEMLLHFFNKDKVKIKTISLYELGSTVIEYEPLSWRTYKAEMAIEFGDSDEDNKEIYKKTRYIIFESEPWCITNQD